MIFNGLAFKTKMFDTVMSAFISLISSWAR